MPNISRRFELRDPSTNSNKFWEINVTGKILVRRWGRIGTEGQVRTENFNSSFSADVEAAALIRSKMREGYKEVVDSFSDNTNTGFLRRLGDQTVIVARKARKITIRRKKKDDDQPPKDSPPKDSQSLDISERSIDL